jgi:uncharacterized membrane protein YcaP (DUF421 family)
MSYVSIFEPIPWEAVGTSVVQAISIFIVVILGLKMTGRRVFAERGPQDLIILLLVAEACNLGLSDEGAGYWGTFFSIITLFILGGMTERVPWLRTKLEEDPITLYNRGELDQAAMKNNFIDEKDLEETAREYGLPSYRSFSRIVLEGNGTISGVVSHPVTGRAAERG